MNTRYINSETFGDTVEVDQLLIDRFVSSPGSYIHQSWFDLIEHGEILRNLSITSRVEGRISDAISKRFNLKSVSKSEFSDPIVASVYLAEADQLRHLIWTLGLLIHSSEIRRVVDGKMTRSIVANIGEPSYRYAFRELCCQELVADEERVSIFDNMQVLSDPCEKIVSSGIKAIAPFCLTCSKTLNRYFSLKLPVSWSLQFSNPFNNVDAAMSRNLISEIFRDLTSMQPSTLEVTFDIGDVAISRPTVEGINL